MELTKKAIVNYLADNSFRPQASFWQNDEHVTFCVRAGVEVQLYEDSCGNLIRYKIFENGNTERCFTGMPSNTSFEDFKRELLWCF